MIGKHITSNGEYLVALDAMTGNAAISDAFSVCFFAIVMSTTLIIKYQSVNSKQNQSQFKANSKKIQGKYLDAGGLEMIPMPLYISLPLNESMETGVYVWRTMQLPCTANV